MEYFRINYKKLEHLHQSNYFVFILFTLVILTALILMACFKDTYKSETFYGIHSNNLLSFKINTKLSDILKKNNKITFNNKEVSYKINNFDSYEIVGSEIYQTVDLELDGYFYQNEVGEIKLYYDKEKIIFYILELFK